MLASACSPRKRSHPGARRAGRQAPPAADVQIDKDYVFEGADGKASLRDLFEGRRQPIVYHFMFGPAQEDGCGGCSMFVDNIGHLATTRRPSGSEVRAPRTAETVACLG